MHFLFSWLSTLEEEQVQDWKVKSLQWEQQKNFGLTGITGALYMFVHKHVVTCGFEENENTTSFTICTSEGFHLLGLYNFLQDTCNAGVYCFAHAIRIWEHKILVRCFRIA